MAYVHHGQKNCSMLFRTFHFWTDALTCMSFSAGVSHSIRFQRQTIIRNAAKVTSPVMPGFFAERKAERVGPPREGADHATATPCRSLAAVATDMLQRVKCRGGF